MNSPIESACKHLAESNSYSQNINDLSPVTDLAMNMKSLTTLTGTPSRRISWSDSFPAGDGLKCLGDISPCTDSPMLQEILKKNVNKCKRIVSRKVLALDSGEEKENVPPKEMVQLESVLSQNDSVMENDSQDSGYSSTSVKLFRSCAVETSTPHIRAHSSVFPNMNSEQFDSGLYFLEEDDDDMDISGPNMNSLLTKPLCNFETCSVSPRKVKLPSRRCLTLEMDNLDLLAMNLGCSSENTEVVQDNRTSTDLKPLGKFSFKRPESSDILIWKSKRRKSSPAVSSEDISENVIKQRSFSETAATIMQAVQKSDLYPDLIGDCSRHYALPLIKGRHQDLKCISADTLVQVLKGEFNHEIDSFTLVDCRYPYEYDGGHIVGAQNIYTKEDIIRKFLENVPEQTSKREIIIFHCEFSSERAPNICRFLRNKDRELNECSYPKLHHPEIYLLDGGYKNFFSNFKKFCDPQDYKPMNHKDHSSEFRLFRAKSKSWGSDSKARYKMKSFSCTDNI